MNNLTKKVILQALDSAPMPTIIVAMRKSGLTVVYVNSAVELLTGRDSADLVGMPFADILAKGGLPGATDDTVSALRHQWHTHDGLSVPLDVRVSSLQDRPGRPGFWVFSVVGEAQSPDDKKTHDTAELHSELVDARRQIKCLQRTDPVTGLASRAAFDEVLERDWSIARRDRRRISIILFSVDCLAEYNEIFGRHATDSLLQKIAHAISGTLRRAGDFGARIANDQFAVLIGEADEVQVETCANRIAAKVRNLAIHHPRSTAARFATVSYGAVSEVPAWTKKSLTLLEEAEHQLDTERRAVEKQRQAVVKSPSNNEEAIT